MRWLVCYKLMGKESTLPLAEETAASSARREFP